MQVLGRAQSAHHRSAYLWTSRHTKFIDGFRISSVIHTTSANYDILVHEVDGERFSIGSYDFDFISLPPAGNHGLRFVWRGKQYAITGDSNFTNTR
jgi:hypothetical protein